MSEETKETKKDKKAKGPLSALARAKAAIGKATGQKPLSDKDTRYGFVSTGSFPIDMLIGGSPAADGKGLRCPGFPRRRITEVYGPESSGKTTIAISAMVQAQKAGGCALFIDFEHALDLGYAKAQGLDLDEDKCQVYQPDNMEDGFKQMYIGIMAGIDIIVVDSVAAMLPKSEIEKGFDDSAKIGAVARQFSLVLPKFVMWLSNYPHIQGEKGKRDPDHEGTALVFINQTRSLIQTSGGGHGGAGGDENTSGGKALKFYAFLRLRAQRIKSESIKVRDSITGKDVNKAFGNVTNVKVVKSKVDAKQGHSTQMFIRYGTGIDDYYSIIETGVVQRLIKKEGGGYFTLKEFRVRGKDKMRKYLIENPKVYDALKMALAQAVNAGAQGATDQDLEEGDELMEGLDELGGEDGEIENIEEVVLDEGEGGE